MTGSPEATENLSGQETSDPPDKGTSAEMFH